MSFLGVVGRSFFGIFFGCGDPVQISMPHLEQEKPNETGGVGDSLFSWFEHWGIWRWVTDCRSIARRHRTRDARLHTRWAQTVKRIHLLSQEPHAPSRGQLVT